jgi:hypothetical protein
MVSAVRSLQRLLYIVQHSDLAMHCDSCSLQPCQVPQNCPLSLPVVLQLLADHCTLLLLYVRQCFEGAPLAVT